MLRPKSARLSFLYDRLRIAIAEAGAAVQEGAIVLAEDARIRDRRRAADRD